MGFVYKKPTTDLLPTSTTAEGILVGDLPSLIVNGHYLNSGGARAIVREQGLYPYWVNLRLPLAFMQSSC
jgi:hypothetical protein